MTNETLKPRRVDSTPAHVASGVTVSRRGAMNMIVKSAVAASIVPTIASASSNNDDPIFTAIEAHRVAYKAYGAAINRCNEVSEANLAKAEVWADKAGDEECCAVVAMIATIPTTALGIAALLGYLRDPDFEAGEYLGGVLHGKFDPTGKGQAVDITCLVVDTVITAARGLHERQAT